MLLIYNIGYKVFFWFKRLRRRFRFFEKVARLYEYYFSLLLNRKFVSWLVKHSPKRGLNVKPRDEEYIISLTSFPARISYVHIAIETLMRQTFKPDCIILWLAESQFPEKKLPENLTRLESLGLTIRWCDDLRSHKKYHYVLQENPNANIILADDDIFYPRDMLAVLVKEHKKRPKDIIASIGAQIHPNLSALPSTWIAPTLKKTHFSNKIQAYSGQGTLYPAQCFPKEIFQKKKAIELAASADDLWLQAMSLLTHTKTTLIHPRRGFPVNIEILNDQPLFRSNNADGENLNDKIWDRLVREYALDQYDEE